MYYEIVVRNIPVIRANDLIVNTIEFNSESIARNRLCNLHILVDSNVGERFGMASRGHVPDADRTRFYRDRERAQGRHITLDWLSISDEGEEEREQETQGFAPQFGVREWCGQTSLSGMREQGQDLSNSQTRERTSLDVPSSQLSNQGAYTASDVFDAIQVGTGASTPQLRQTQFQQFYAEHSARLREERSARPQRNSTRLRRSENDWP